MATRESGMLNPESEKKTNSDQEIWGFKKTVDEFWNRKQEFGKKPGLNRGPDKERRSSQGAELGEARKQAEKRESGSKAELLKKRLAELDVEIDLARLSRNEKWHEGLLKIQEDLRGMVDETEAESAFQNYDSEWNKLRKQIAEAEGRDDEKEVVRLEEQIRNLENNQLTFIAQAEALAAEKLAAEQAAKALEQAEAVRAELEKTREPAYDILMRIRKAGKEKIEAVAALADQKIEKLDEELEPKDPADAEAETTINKSTSLKMQKSLKGKLRRFTLIALTALSSMMPTKARAESSSGNAEGQPVATSVEEIPAQFKQAFEQAKKGKLKNLSGWRLHWNTLFERNPDTGKIDNFNPEALIFPAYLEMPSTVRDSGVLKSEIPYEYARLFEVDPESRKNLNKGDYQKLEAYVKQNMLRQLEETISGLNMSERRTRYLHGEEQAQRPKIKSITVKGFASPEGPASRGPSTLKRGVVDQENIKLASARAMGGYETMKAAMREFGMSESEFEKVASSITPEETQFSDQELASLAKLASNEQGIADDEKIFNLVQKYNDGKIKDQSVVEQLNKIVGSKRKIEITIQYENNSKSYLVIGLPLLLLALPLLRRRRGGEEKPGGGEEIVGGGDGGKDKKKDDEEGFKPPIVPILEKDEDLEKVKIPEKITKIDVWEQNSEEYKHAEYETYVNDLWVNFDSEDAIRRGVDYRAICNEMNKIYPDFAGKNPGEDREHYLTYVLVRIWRQHDITARRDSGWQSNLEDGLDYENQPEQIKWARMHARGLLHLVEQKRGNPSKDYLDILKERSAQALDRRLVDDMEKMRVLDERRANRAYRSVEDIAEELAAEEELEKATHKTSIDIQAEIAVSLGGSAEKPATEAVESKAETKRLSIDDLKEIIRNQVGAQAEVKKIDIIPQSGGVKLHVEADAGLSGGKVTVDSLIQNSGNGLGIKNLKIDSRFYTKGKVEKTFRNLDQELRSVLEKRFKKKIKSMKIDGSGLVVETR